MSLGRMRQAGPPRCLGRSLWGRRLVVSRSRRGSRYGSRSRLQCLRVQAEVTPGGGLQRQRRSRRASVAPVGSTCPRIWKPGVSQNSKSGRAGKSYIGRNGLRPQVPFPFTDADFEKVLQTYDRALKSGLLPGLNEVDVEMVFRYVWWPRGNSTWVLERIAAGGLDGLALLLHEAVELREFFLGRYNPWKAGDQRRGYHWNHGRATLQEHRLMLSIARQKGYVVDNVWDMIRTDANAIGPDMKPKLRPAQIHRNLRAAGARIGLGLEEIPASRPESLAEAERFWQDVIAGKLKIDDVDFVAIQADGRP